MEFSINGCFQWAPNPDQVTGILKYTYSRKKDHVTQIVVEVGEGMPFQRALQDCVWHAGFNDVVSKENKRLDSFYGV